LASVIRIALVLAVVVAAAIAANVALLSVAAGSHERVGQLSPVLAGSPTSTPPVASPSASRPDNSTVPARGDEEAEVDADD
jgi:hypothetical protein